MSRKSAIAGLVAIGIGLSLIFVAYARTGTTTSPADPKTNLAQSDNANGPTEVEIVTLRPWGFEPKELTRRPGPFFLNVDNRSEFDEIDVSLDAESGKKVHTLNLPKNKGRWRQKLVLTPGTYLLRATNNPEWSCRITVQP